MENPTPHPCVAKIGTFHRDAIEINLRQSGILEVTVLEIPVVNGLFLFDVLALRILLQLAGFGTLSNRFCRGRFDGTDCGGNFDCADRGRNSDRCEG